MGPEGKRDLLLEDSLSGLEAKFAKVRREKLEKGLSLDQGDIAVLLMFAATMLSRTVSQREHQSEQWGRVRGMGEKLEEAVATGNVVAQPATHSGPTFTMDDVRRIVEQPLQQTLPPFASATYEVFRTLDLTVLEATTEPGFITSDTPCVVGASELDERPPTFSDSVLHLPSTEVCLPLSPHFCLLLTRGGFVGWQKIPAVLLDEFNRRVRFACHHQFVVNQELKSDYWFSEIPRDFSIP